MFIHNSLTIVRSILFLVAIAYFVIISPICIIHLVKLNGKKSPLPTLIYWLCSPLIIALVALVLAVI